jgi:hypothetical protein
VSVPKPVGLPNRPSSAPVWGGDDDIDERGVQKNLMRRQRVPRSRHPTPGAARPGAGYGGWRRRRRYHGSGDRRRGLGPKT